MRKLYYTGNKGYRLDTLKTNFIKCKLSWKQNRCFDSNSLSLSLSLYRLSYVSVEQSTIKLSFQSTDRSATVLQPIEREKRFAGELTPFAAVKREGGSKRNKESDYIRINRIMFFCWNGMRDRDIDNRFIAFPRIPFPGMYTVQCTCRLVTTPRLLCVHI